VFAVVAAILWVIATAVLINQPISASRLTSAVYAAGIGLPIFAVVWLLPWLSRRQQRRLLQTGHAVKAVIVEKQRYLTPRHVRAKIVYEFIDQQGQSVRGVRAGLPAAVLYPGAIIRPDLAAMLANPTVIYDRDAPHINMLYPLDQVEIA
jgi:hypothetical protein